MTDSPVTDRTFLFTLPELTTHLGGFIHSQRRWSILGLNPYSEKVGICGFSIDSRNIRPEDLFIPLPGLRTDGHAYLESAAESGCQAALVSRDFYRMNTNLIRRLADQYPIVIYLVRDVLGGLHTLARQVLNRMHIYRIGVTGSNGKTTTKELLASILTQNSATFVTPGNFNSVIGLPLAIPSITKEHKYGVFEMAMSERGEMQRLADLVFPDAGIITNIGTAHIGNIGTQLGIAQEKFEIFRNCGPDTIAVLPEADDFSQRLRSKIRGRIYNFGSNTTPGYQGCEDRGIEGQIIKWKSQKIHLSLPGSHNLHNALAALTLSQVLGIPDDQIIAGLESYNPLFGRSQVVTGEATVVVDCYNANPDSMTASLQTFKSLKTKGKKVLVLGDMKELGRFSKESHRDLAHQIMASGVSNVLLFGSEIRVTYEILEAYKSDTNLFRWTDDRSQLENWVAELVKPGDLVLLKASRSMALENLAEVITKTLEVR